MSRIVVFFSLATLIYAAPPVRKWHAAEVIGVRNTAMFRYYEIVDSYDSGCRLTYREIRNPFKPLDLSEGLKVRIAAGNGPTIYLIDKSGRTHKGTLAVQYLAPPPPPPPPRENAPK